MVLSDNEMVEGVLAEKLALILEENYLSSDLFIYLFIWSVFCTVLKNISLIPRQHYNVRKVGNAPRYGGEHSTTRTTGKEASMSW